MSILRVQKVVVETVNLVSSCERIRKVEPRFTDKDQGWVFIKNDGTEIELVSGEASNIPGKNFKDKTCDM